MRKGEICLLCVALCALAACDRKGARDLGHEREAAAYREAMADYHAGRLEAAVKGFEKVCRQDPANASARFQLACLLQSSGKDYLAALCAFREYMFQQPDSDKSEAARDRIAICEKEYAMSLASKYGLDGGAALLKELESTRKRLEASEQRATKGDQEFAQAMRRIAALQQENERLVRMIRNDADESADKPAELATARKLLDGGEEASSDRIRASADAAALRFEEADETDGDRRRLARDAAALRAEEKSESEAASSIVPAQAPNAKALRDAARAKPKKEPLHEARPKTYVVRDGDTLYKIAMRFYGTSSAWKKIRDANKAVITTDGRVKTGLEIRLP